MELETTFFIQKWPREEKENVLSKKLTNFVSQLDDFSKNTSNGRKVGFWTSKMDKNRRFKAFEGELFVNYHDQRLSTFWESLLWTFWESLLCNDGFLVSNNDSTSTSTGVVEKHLELDWGKKMLESTTEVCVFDRQTKSAW